jgi:hypothetical protein
MSEEKAHEFPADQSVYLVEMAFRSGARVVHPFLQFDFDTTKGTLSYQTPGKATVVIINPTDISIARVIDVMTYRAWGENVQNYSLMPARFKWV